MTPSLIDTIHPDHPAGTDCETGHDYDTLDDLMMPYGTPHQNKIPWEEVETLAQRILVEECKHFKVLLFYITAKLIQTPLTGLTVGMQLVADFWSCYHETGFPQGGERGVKRRRMLLDSILERLERCAQQHLTPSLSSDQLDAVEVSFQALDKALQAHRIRNPLSAIGATLAERRQTDTNTTASASPESMSINKTQAPTHQVPTTSVSDENALKHHLLVLAEQSFTQQPDSPLAYVLRRHVQWSHITSAPPGKKSNPEQTEMAPPNRDSVNRYGEHIAQQDYSLDLLNQLENAIGASLFWLTGSVYSAQVALGLGYPLVAASISQAIEQFITRVPALAVCTFSDGTPFLEAKEWQALQTQIANTAPVKSADAPIPNTPRPDTRETIDIAATRPTWEWSALEAEIQTCLDNDGVQAALEKINTYRLQATSPRAAGYLQLFACETLHHAGLQTLSHDMLEALTQQAQTLCVNDWEPDYYQRGEALRQQLKASNTKESP